MSEQNGKRHNEIRIPEQTVACIMLTRDRPEYARCAVECFRAQTYERKRLLIYNTGDISQIKVGYRQDGCYHVHSRDSERSIGRLRNDAISYCNRHLASDIIVHWDDDDWSHPNRIADQVELLQASGADCVGYREVPFWDTRRTVQSVPSLESGCAAWVEHASEAWMYTNTDPRACIGSSFCYWRKAWEKRPFPDRMRGEDVEWLKGVRSLGATLDAEPRMICRIHGGNTAGYDYENVLLRSVNWQRAPQWDSHCREVMS